MSADGEKYLLIYGVLQVMEVHQDAVRFLCESLAIPYSPPKELSNIRAIRCDTIGHPIRSHQYVDIINLISVQRNYVEEKLREVVQRLRDDEMAHR